MIFVLSGAVCFERWKVQLGPGQHVGVLDFFGLDTISTSSSLVGTAPGSIAGISFAQLNEMLGRDGNMVHNLLLVLGESGTRVVQVGISYS